MSVIKTSTVKEPISTFTKEDAVLLMEHVRSDIVVSYFNKIVSKIEESAKNLETSTTYDFTKYDEFLIPELMGVLNERGFVVDTESLFIEESDPVDPTEPPKAVAVLNVSWGSDVSV